MNPNTGDTVLHSAAKHGSIQILKHLVSINAAIEMKNNKGEPSYITFIFYIKNFK